LTKLMQKKKNYFIFILMSRSMFENIQIHTVKREFHASVHQTKQAKMIMVLQCFRLSH
jgi:hypothetical protein